MICNGIISGAILIAIALIGYFGSGRESWTALIPSFIGVPILLSALLSLKSSRRKHAMHIAATFGLLGLLASAGKLIANIARGTLEFGLTSVSLFVMALVCGSFLALCIQSFRAARRASKES